MYMIIKFTNKILLTVILLFGLAKYSFSQVFLPLFEAPANVAYEDIQWPWFDKNSEFAKKREEAMSKLKALHGEFIHPNIQYTEYFKTSEKRVNTVLQFHWDSIPDGNYNLGVEPLWVPKEVTDDLLRETLPYLPDLKCIFLPMTSVTDEGVRLFSCLKYLEDVRFLSADPKDKPVCITPESLKILAKQNNIKRILLSGVNFADKDVECLADMKDLESIDISYCPLTSECFRTLVRIPNLKSITMSVVDLSAPIDDDLVDIIASGKCKWTEIDLRIPNMSEKLVKALMKVKTLKNIELSKLPPKDSWDDIAAIEDIRRFATTSWPSPYAGSSGRKKEDSDWVRFYATKIKPPVDASTVSFWYRQLQDTYPEMDAWLQEAEQRTKEELLQRK